MNANAGSKAIFMPSDPLQCFLLNADPFYDFLSPDLQTENFRLTNSTKFSKKRNGNCVILDLQR